MTENKAYRTPADIKFADLAHNRHIEKQKLEVQVGSILIVSTVGFNTYFGAPPKTFRARVLQKFEHHVLVEMLENGVKECFNYDDFNIEKRGRN